MGEKTMGRKILEELIKNKVQESLNLEYKSALALGKDKDSDITKDVSSFANSDGGTLIYGIKEYNNKDKRHLPEEIDPVDIRKYSKEWLAQKINMIRPMIEGLVIEPVMIGENEVVYVVEIPKGTVAHQALDKRYYRRFNSISTPMEDYEIRDINNRNIYPNIQIEFRIKTKIWEQREFMPPSLGFHKPKDIRKSTKLKVYANNIGKVVTNYVSARLYVPNKLLLGEGDEENENGMRVLKVLNRYRDVAEYHSIGMSVHPKSYNPFRFEPILPNDYLFLDDFEISNNFDVFFDSTIHWKVNADNAPERVGEILVKDIKYKLKDETKNE